MKKMLYCIPMLVCLLLTGCAEKYKDTTLYQRNGRAKPIVAVLPVIDNRQMENNLENSRGVTWDISKELTEGIRNRISDSQKLYLLKDQGSIEIAQKLNTSDCSQLSKRFSQGLNSAEFMVVTELVNQQEKPFEYHRFSPKNPAKGEISEVLSIDFRVRVFDMREENPKLILQEVIHNNHLIAKPQTQFDYSHAEYGSTSFCRTPMGIAHNRLIREVTGRIENYIRATKG